MPECGAILVFSFSIFVITTKLLAHNVIDVDDILSEDFMPGTILMLENPKESIRNFNDSVDSLDFSLQNGDGSFNYAMETMEFHRSKMNEYLCRNYVAEEIISDMTLSRIKRRMGTDSPGIQTRTVKGQESVKTQLLADEGSSKYKDWLHKSTTLEDIYRHYDNMNNRIDDRSEDPDKDDEINEDYDQNIAGYSFHQQQMHQMQQPGGHGGSAKLGHNGAGGGMYGAAGFPYSHGGSNGGGHRDGGGGHSFSYSGSGGGGGYGTSGISSHSGSGGGGYGHNVEPEHIVHEQPKYHIIHEESHSSKEHDLSDLFEIALTALAYLSFGMFVIHVVMCISTASNQTSTATAMMMPMSISPTSTGTTGGDTGGGMTSTGGDMTSTGNGMTSTGNDMTSTGNGMTSTGGGDVTSTGNEGMTSTGGGATGTGGGMTATGGDGTGGGGDTGGGTTGTGGTGNGGTGNGATGTGNGSTGNGGTGDGGDTGDTAPGTGTGGTGTGTGGTGGTATGTGTTGDTGTGTGTATETGTGRDTIKFRYRRDIPTITNPNNQALNELARRILTSIEAAFVANDDDGNCLRQTLCENNKYSRTLDGKNKILIPVWSLGMSWISGRLAKNINPATSMLDSLKASILGLGNSNCEVIYQKCDLRLQKGERRRRRKRNSEKKSYK